MQILENHGVDHKTARAVVNPLVSAQRDNISTHGPWRLLHYVEQIDAGLIDKGAIPVVEKRAPSVIAVDARNGFSYPAIKQGVKLALKDIHKQGIMMVGVKNSSHFGAGSVHVESLASKGVIALLFGNSNNVVAAKGGTYPLFGTNPLVAAFPNADGPPFVIDMSSSKVAQGAIGRADAQGEPIPDGVAIDKSGQPTTNAQAALSGALLPDGRLGTGMAVVVELLAAALTGSNFGHEGGTAYDTKKGPQGWGQTLVLIDPKAFGSHGFGERVSTLINWMKIGDPQAHVPGENRLKARKRSYREGAEIDAQLHEQLVELANKPPVPHIRSPMIGD